MAEPAEGELIVSETPGCEALVDIRPPGKTVWLPQRRMSEIFETTSENVSMHLKNMFSDNELEEPATTTDCLVVRTKGEAAFGRVAKFSLVGLAWVDVSIIGCHERRKALGERKRQPKLIYGELRVDEASPPLECA